MTAATTQITEATTHTLDVPGAVLTYDVRRAEDSAGPALMLIGSPMGAAGFGTLAKHFPTGRSSPTTRAAPSAARKRIRRASRRRSSTPTTSIGSSGRSVDPSTSSRPAVAR